MAFMVTTMRLKGEVQSPDHVILGNRRLTTDHGPQQLKTSIRLATQFWSDSNNQHREIQRNWQPVARAVRKATQQA
eukprot:2775893-Amphidinium_carterae.1